MLRVLLFDLDGTLADTDAVHLPTWMEVLRPHDIELSRELYEESVSGRLGADVVADLLPDLSPEQARKLAKAQEERALERTREVGPLPGLKTLLEEGRERGLKLALVTNSTEEDARTILEALLLEEAFDPVVLPAEVSKSKPAPAPYQEALQRLGISPDEALAFEDSPTGVSSAVEVGVPTVGIASTHDPEELRRAGVELVVGDFADPALYHLLERLGAGAPGQLE